MSSFRTRLLLAAVLAAVALGAACGGSSGASSTLSDDDVAVVGDTHITRDQLDHQIKLKVQSAKVDKQTLPKAGSADYRTQVIDPTVQRLVTEAVVENIATELNVTVSDDEVQKKLDEAVKQQFGTDKQKYQDFLKKYGITEDDIKQQVIRPSLLQTKIQDKLKAQYPVTDQQIQAYYDKNKATFITPDTRKVHYVLAKNKADADAAHKELSQGASFDEVVKKYSLDYQPGTPPDQLGALTASKGQVETNFGTAVFADLKTGGISQPVEVSKPYADQNLSGKCKPDCYFVIRADDDIAKGSSQSIDDVRDQIKSTLEQTVQGPKLSKRIQQLLDEQKKLTHYAPGFKPATPANPSSTGGTSP